VKNEQFYFARGINYGKRGNCLSIQAMPAEMIFTDEGQAIFPNQQADETFIIGLLNTRLYRFLINSYCGQHKHSGYVNVLPGLPISMHLKSELARLAEESWQGAATRAELDETSNLFVSVIKPEVRTLNLGLIADFLLRDALHTEASLLLRRLSLEGELAGEMHVLEEDISAVYSCFPGNPIGCKTESKIEPEAMVAEDEDVNNETSDDEAGEKPQFSVEQFGHVGMLCAKRGISLDALLDGKARLVDSENVLSVGQNVISYSLGVAVGRWDVRYATGLSLIHI